jgi:hypothetical protein
MLSPAFPSAAPSGRGLGARRRGSTPAPFHPRATNEELIMTANAPLHRRLGWSLAALMVMSCLETAAVRAETALQLEVRALAQDIKHKLDKEQTRSVAVGEFTPRSRLASNAGPGIRKTLIEELKKLGVQVDEKAAHEIQGHYQDAEDKGSGQLGVRLAARLLDSAGNPLLEFTPRMILGEESVPTLLSATGTFSPTGDARKRSEDLRGYLDRPTVDLRKFTIRAAPNSPYAVEIHVRRDSQYSPRQPENVGGRAFVPLRRKEVFAVVLVNDSDYEAAVALSLDGLSVFAFSENRNYRYWFVPKKSRVRIDGWHLNNRKLAEFVVRSLPQQDSGHYRLPDRGSLGVITACFSAAWSQKNGIPPDEHVSRNSATFIDRGQAIDRTSREVSRYIGGVRAVVSVRYHKDAQ